MKKVICSSKAPGAIGPYSQAIEAGGMVFVSGQLPIDAATGLMPVVGEHQDDIGGSRAHHGKHCEDHRFPGRHVAFC